MQMHAESSVLQLHADIRIKMWVNMGPNKREVASEFLIKKANVMFQVKTTPKTLNLNYHIEEVSYDELVHVHTTFQYQFITQGMTIFVSGLLKVIIPIVTLFLKESTF